MDLSFLVLKNFEVVMFLNFGQSMKPMDLSFFGVEEFRNCHVFESWSVN